MKIKKLFKEGLSIDQMMKIRNDYYNAFEEEYESFILEFEGKDSALVPLLIAMENLKNAYELFLRKKGYIE